MIKALYSDRLQRLNLLLLTYRRLGADVTEILTAIITMPVPLLSSHLIARLQLEEINLNLKIFNVGKYSFCSGTYNICISLSTHTVVDVDCINSFKPRLDCGSVRK